MYTYKKKTTSEPNAEVSDKSKAGFPETDKEFSLIDSSLSPIRKMGFGSAAAPNRTGLSDKLKSGVENLSGYSLDGVKVHYNSPKPAQFRAAAYTAGKNIFVGPGHESSLPHEAWHVVQQMKGEVSPTNKIDGVNVNETPALEREADIMGKKALSRTEPSGSELISAEPRSDVEQFDHVINLTDPTPAVAGTLKECPRPTVVFECPVRFQKNYDEIYQQSLKYTDRNTICVFGINSQNGGAFMVDTDNPPVGAGAASEFSHLVYYCKFKWTPVPGESGRGYAFPAVEARQAIANAAKKITDDIQNAPGNDEHRQNDLSKTFAYRWLDEDSREEYTPALSKTIDTLSKKGETALMGGMYDWRIEESDIARYHPSSKSFLDELNTAERLLRQRFIELANKFKPIAAKDGLVGCYVPESTLMMNQTAHDIIAGEMTQSENGSSHITAKGALTHTLAAGNQTPDTTAQDKESAKAMFKLGAIVNECITPAIKTTKPVKFQQNASGVVDKSYLGKEFYEAISSGQNAGSLRDKTKFYNALKSVRQSVFDNGHWFFKNNEYGDWTNPQNCDKNALNDKTKMNEKPIRCVQLSFNADRRNMADILFIVYTSTFLSRNDAERRQKTKDALRENNADNPLRIPYCFLGQIPDADKHIAEGKAVHKSVTLVRSAPFYEIYDTIGNSPSFQGDELQNTIMELIREKDTEKAKEGVAKILAEHFEEQTARILSDKFEEQIEADNLEDLAAKTQAHLTEREVAALLSKMLDEIIRRNAVGAVGREAP